MRILKLPCLALHLLTIAVLPLPAADVFWLYVKDRYDRPSLTESLEVPDGVDPYEFLAEHGGYEEWMIRREKDVVFLAEKACEGEVPILCLHKISREDKYALSPERFRRLCRLIKDDGWYLVSDYQYIEGDFSRVPTGLKPIVMGSDDASHGNMIYQTHGDRLTGRVVRFFGKPLLDRDCMVDILERYIPREDGRINFTFYVSFDAVPFRQLDGAVNPGFPYRGVPVISEKIRYLDDNFILGLHTMSHIYAYDLEPAAFAEDLMSCWEILDEYAGGEAKSVRTLAFPFGIRSLTPELRSAVTELSRHGRRLSGAFDFDNNLAPPPGSPGDEFDISRFIVDNKNWDRLLKTLDEADAVHARRMIVWETDTKRLPGSRWGLGASPADDVWVLVRDNES